MSLPTEAFYFYVCPIELTLAQNINQLEFLFSPP
jgi:hypothetical protein